MKRTTLTILVMVLAVDLAYKIITKTTQPLLSPPEVIVLALMIFVGAGDRIVEFAVGKDLLKISQNVEKQAREVEKDAAALLSISKDYRPDLVDQLLSRATGQTRDVWSRMVVYRLTMRVLLRRLCAAHGMVLNDTTAFITMLHFIKEKGVISVYLQEQVESIRDATFFFEWGTGIAPNARQIKDALEKAPDVIRQLEEMGSRLAKETQPHGPMQMP
jgi:hypothetical protein